MVAAVFDAYADVEVTCSTEPKSPGVHRARLSAVDGERSAGLRVSYEVFGATVSYLGGSAVLYGYDDEEDREAVLRSLALVVRAHLRGEGRVENRHGWFRS